MRAVSIALFHIGLGMAVSLAGCGDSSLGLNGADAGPGATVTPDLAQSPDLTQVPDLAVTKSGIGDPCTGSGGLNQGSCMDGQACIPDPQFGFVDGYCTAQCGGNMACPTDATCIVVGGQFSLCFLNCGTDADCRMPDYHCVARGGHATCQPVNMGGGGNNGGVPVGTGPNGSACVMPVQKPGDIKGGIFGPNTQLTGNAKSIEAEVEIAVDPTNKNVVIAYNALTNNAGSFGLVASGDDGNTFGKEVFLPADKVVDNNREQSDPVVAVNSKGEFLISWVGFDRTQQNPNPSNMHIYVARSTNGGVTWPEVIQVSPNGEWQNGGFLDKPWIYANPLDDSVYLTWDRQANQNSGVDIRMARSGDGGKTWDAPVNINDAGKRPNADRNLAQLAIGANGLPVVTWVEIGNQQFGSTANQVYVQRFNQAGKPNGANVLVTHQPDSPAFEDPSIAVSGNNVYVGFISGTPKGVWDVQVAASLDGGATWQPSVKANDDPSCATHFHHQIAADAKGNVHAIWYDNRYLTGNVFHASSGPADANNKLAFGKNTFVNDIPFTFTTRRDQGNWLGDYLGLWTQGSEIYAAWTDNRTNNASHIFFAQGKLQ